jgi:hypothetical protein
MTEVIGGGIGSSVRRGNLTVREKIEGDHKLIPRRSLFLGTYFWFFSWQVWLGSMG